MREPLCDESPTEIGVPMTLASSEMLAGIAVGTVQYCDPVTYDTAPGAEGRVRAIAARLLQERS